MKDKIYNIINKINITVTTLLLILTPLFLGSFKDSYINNYLFAFILLDIIAIIQFILKPQKIDKKIFLYFLFILTYLLPLFSKDIVFINTHIKITILILSTLILAININQIMSKEQLFKTIIISSTITVITSILYIFYPNILESFSIKADYGDFYLSSIYRLYGTLNYPNALALFSLIGIILSFKWLDKKPYKIIFYINMLGLLLTISKSTLIFAIIIFIIYIIKNKEIRYNLFASILPLMLNLNTFREAVINNNLFYLLITTLIFFIIYYGFYILLNKKKIIYIIICISIITFAIIFPNKSLTITKNNNPDIFIVDFMGLKKGTYEITIKLKADNFDGNVYLYKQFLQKHNMSYILVKQEKLNNIIKIKFKTEKDAEYYSLKISNNLVNFDIENIETENKETKKNIPANYHLWPYNYVKQLEQIKYDGTSIGSRLDIYKLCFQIIKDNPLLGHGFDYFKVANKDTNLDYILVEHSQIMTLGVQNGIVSILIWILLLIMISIEIIKKWKKENFETILILVLLIYTSLFDFSMSYQFFLLLLFTFSIQLLKKNTN